MWSRTCTAKHFVQKTMTSGYFFSFANSSFFKKAPATATVPKSMTSERAELPQNAHFLSFFAIVRLFYRILPELHNRLYCGNEKHRRVAKGAFGRRGTQIPR